MSFIQSAFLIGLAAVAIPIALHFLTRWQVDRIDLGTSRFLREIVHDGAKRRVIRRWLLLFSRIAVVALLTFLFARPYFSHTAYDDKDRMRIILIDRSASMGMRGDRGRLIDDAISGALASASELGPNAQISWAWFDANVVPVKSKTARLTAPTVLIGDTNYSNALSWARDQIASRKDMQSDVVLITDLQQSGLGRASLDDSSINFPKEAPIKIVDVGRVAANNLGIISATVPTQHALVGSQVSVKASLFNYSPVGYEEIPLVASLNNGSQNLRVKKSISLASDQGNEFYFDVGALPKGRWEITVTADVDDDLAFDNSRYTAIEVAEPVATLIVDAAQNTNQSRSAGFYLSAALGSLTTEQSMPSSNAAKAQEVSEYASYLITDLSELAVKANPRAYPLCIVAAATQLDVHAIEVLMDYVDSGGKLLVFADGSSDAGQHSLDAWNNSKLVPGQLLQVRQAGATPFRIVNFDQHSSMLGLFSDPQEGDLSRIAFQKIRTCTSDDRARIVASFDQGIPAIVECKVGQGRVLWFMSSSDSSASNWTKSPLYVPLIQQMVGDLLDRTGEGAVRLREIGAIARLGAETDEQVLRPVGYQATEASSSASRSHEPGFNKSENHLYVYNSAAKESDTTRATVEDFASHFDLNLASSDSKRSNLRSSEARDEYWYWIAALLMAAVVGEFSLSNRTSA